jgi:hypothetical protein
VWIPRRSPGVVDSEDNSTARAFSPACRLVRPPHTIPMFLPSSRRTLSLPRRKPSPVAERMTIEIMPHRIPNIVRKLLSLLARRFSKV